TIAWVEGAGGGGGTPGFQPEIVPSSAAKMKRAGPEDPPLETTKPGPPLKTMPVGAPATDTTSDEIAPAPLYRVDLSVPLSATHHTLVALATRPQPLTRLGSVWSAGIVPSETRL